MIKFFSMLVLLLCGTANLYAQSDADLIESTVLWRVELAPDWTPIELAELLEDETRFEADGNFYKLLTPLAAFGGNVSYVGLLGVELVPGPNVVVEASPAEIAAYMEDKYGLEFESNVENSAFQADLEQDIKLFITPHPNIVESTIVIGAYLGL